MILSIKWESYPTKQYLNPNVTMRNSVLMYTLTLKLHYAPWRELLQCLEHLQCPHPFCWKAAGAGPCLWFTTFQVTWPWDLSHSWLAQGNVASWKEATHVCHQWPITLFCTRTAQSCYWQSPFSLGKWSAGKGRGWGGGKQKP